MGPMRTMGGHGPIGTMHQWGPMGSMGPMGPRGPRRRPHPYPTAPPSPSRPNGWLPSKSRRKNLVRATVSVIWHRAFVSSWLVNEFTSLWGLTGQDAPHLAGQPTAWKISWSWWHRVFLISWSFLWNLCKLNLARSQSCSIILQARAGPQTWGPLAQRRKDYWVTLRVCSEGSLLIRLISNSSHFWFGALWEARAPKPRNT